MSDQPTVPPGDDIDPTAGSGPDRALDAVGALAEPTRRALYTYVVGQHDWVSRDAAASALELRRGITAHHLDRLVADGLLEVDQRRLTGRSGPGAGRPAKVYRRAPTEVDVSLPPRRYDLAGRLLTEAVDRARRDGSPVEAALHEATQVEGRAIGAAVRARSTTEAGAAPSPGEEAGRGACRSALYAELRDRGYEPDTGDDDVTVLRNCPFHQLSREHTDLICGMNLDLLQAVVAGVDEVGLEARLEPEPGACCVRFHPTDPSPATAVPAAGTSGQPDGPDRGDVGTGHPV